MVTDPGSGIRRQAKNSDLTCTLAPLPTILFFCLLMLMFLGVLKRKSNELFSFRPTTIGLLKPRLQSEVRCIFSSQQ